MSVTTVEEVACSSQESRASPRGHQKHLSLSRRIEDVESTSSWAFDAAVCPWVNKDDACPAMSCRSHVEYDYSEVHVEPDMSLCMDYWLKSRYHSMSLDRTFGQSSGTDQSTNMTGVGATRCLSSLLAAETIHS